MIEELYQMFILGTKGEGYKKALEQGLGGIIFFTSDIQNSEQFKQLILECKNSAKIKPFLSIDQEGGRVERTENIHNGKKYLSAKFAYKKGLDFLKTQTTEISKELKDYGINLNFAPCIDVNTNPNNPIIDERAFSDNVDEVIQAGNLVAKTYQDNGIIPCLKHYPGHGDADMDSHLTLPKIDLPLEKMESIHIKPFCECCKTTDMVMVAHLHCTCFEKDAIPTSLSKNAIDYLRNEIGFDGVIISDDMVMKGVTNYKTGHSELVSESQKIIMGIKAGLNMFIYRNSDTETISVIEEVAKRAKTDKILAQNIEFSNEKIMNLKKKYL